MSYTITNRLPIILTTPFFSLNRNGKIIYWNDQSEKLFGLSGKDVLGKFFGSTLELFDKRFFENIKKDLEKEKIWKVNLNIFGKEHKKDIFEAKFSYLNEKRQIIVVLCTNITRRVNEEEELKLKGAMYENMLSHTEELICKLDSKGEIVYVNKTLLDKLGYEEKEILHKNFNQLIQPSYFENNIFDLKSFDKTEVSKGIKLPIITKQGSQSFIPRRERGRNLNYLCYLKELAKEEEKDKPEELYKALVDSSLDGIAVEIDGRIIVANDSFAEMFGYDDGESLVNKDLLDLVSNDACISCICKCYFGVRCIFGIKVFYRCIICGILCLGEEVLFIFRFYGGIDQNSCFRRSYSFVGLSYWFSYFRRSRGSGAGNYPLICNVCGNDLDFGLFSLDANFLIKR